jgi:hypothetical protein
MNWYLFQKTKKFLENEDLLVDEYMVKIFDGKILKNEDIENIIIMNNNNIRLILESYNKALYQYSEYVMSLENEIEKNRNIYFENHVKRK